ncbi:MAG: hypothetical protein ACPGUD_01045 [Parashewanella sp.]
MASTPVQASASTADNWPSYLNQAAQVLTRNVATSGLIGWQIGTVATAGTGAIPGAAIGAAGGVLKTFIELGAESMKNRSLTLKHHERKVDAAVFAAKLAISGGTAGIISSSGNTMEVVSRAAIGLIGGAAASGASTAARIGLDTAGVKRQDVRFVVITAASLAGAWLTMRTLLPKTAASDGDEFERRDGETEQDSSSSFPMSSTSSVPSSTPTPASPPTTAYPTPTIEPDFPPPPPIPPATIAGVAAVGAGICLCVIIVCGIVIYAKVKDAKAARELNEQVERAQQSSLEPLGRTQLEQVVEENGGELTTPPNDLPTESLPPAQPYPAVTNQPTS